MSVPKFTKLVVGEFDNATGEHAINTLSTVGDINRDGVMDFVICGRNGRLAWFENKGETREWEKHLIDDDVAGMLECGGSVADLTGNGYPDVINGSDWRHDEIYWWENPGTTGPRWRKRLIARTGCNKFHDTLVGEVKNDGHRYLVFTNQGGAAVYCVPIPKEPTVSPWPDLEVIATGMQLRHPDYHENPGGFQPDEGLALGDIDGDGQNELVCGVTWYKWVNGQWQAHRFTDRHYITNKIAIGDIDGDGRDEIVLSEADACIYGYREGGKLAWFKPRGDVTGLWEEHIIEIGLLDGHTLCLDDLCGNGHLDILVGEIGVGDLEKGTYDIRAPRVMVYENDGKGHFPTRHTIDEGTGIHEGVLVDLRNRGVLDLIGKPLHGPEKWKIIVWYNESRV